MNIKELTLYTKDLERQKEFYTRTLFLPIYKEFKDTVEFKVGTSILKFVFKKDATPYHYAINIPSNQETEALQWLKNHLDVLKYNNDEIIDFKSWNAKSMYFYDNDKNIVEFIARRNLKIISSNIFSSKSFIEISEIGAPTDDIEFNYNFWNKNYALEIYDGNIEVFCAIGNERGLFIVINKNKKDWLPSGDKAYASDFKVKLEMNSTEAEIEFVNGKFGTVTRST